MKKLIAILALLGFMLVNFNSTAQPDANEEPATTNTIVNDDGSTTTTEITDLNYFIKKYFIEGGPMFMSLVVICLILGLALCIERIIYLNMASGNSKKLLGNIDNALNSGGVNAAKEVCKNTSGPVASIFYQGLDRSAGSIEEVEKSVVQYGGVQMGLLERGLSWIALFIAIAPMLGFLGTVIGMISAFSDIQTAGTMSAEVVAGGIKVALITTVSGLVVAIILQIFYNYILSKVDSIVLDMEDSSIQLVDMLYEHELKNK